MEILELAGYTEEEKVMIAKRHLIPKQLNEHGLKMEEHITWEDDAISMMIRGYTREAGVRNLEREIAAVCRKVTRQFAEGRTEPVNVDKDAVKAYLGAPRFQFEEVVKRTRVSGVATALAWTPVGGDIMFIEATSMPGRRELMLTGMLGDVMKESAQAALSYVRSKAVQLGIDEGFSHNLDVHIHVPAGGVPKDGPSAGITMATALASALTKRPVRRDVAMTGEITLRGKVLAIGGLKEKSLAAHRAGIHTIIMPKENLKDLDEIPEHVKKDLTFKPVSHMDEVLQIALLGAG
jgi:ATP-dependent Lon protease